MEPIDFHPIEEYMSQFSGGEITISKQFWSEGIAIIVISNPTKRNAISGKMMVDFRRCLAELEEWSEGKGVILMGAGSNFCSGGDLDFARQCGTSKDAFYMSIMVYDALSRLRNLPMVSVALVHGPCLGGGAEIAVNCDRMVVKEGVQLGFVQGTMGITTAWGATTRLVQLLGERKAIDLLLKSSILNAKELYDCGLAEMIVCDTNEAIDWLKERIGHEAIVVRSFKLAALAATERGLEESIKLERKFFCQLWGGPANTAALAKNINHVASAKNGHNK